MTATSTAQHTVTMLPEAQLAPLMGAYAEAMAAKRRQRMMQHFGGLQGLARASIDDLQRVPGISKQLAEAIHDALRER